MKKTLLNRSIILAIIGLIAGAFYREFTKFIGFTGYTRLILVHPHLIVLGFIVMFLFVIFIKTYEVQETDKLNKSLNVYFLSVILTAGTLFTRGLLEALEFNMTKAIDASISGIAGIGHIILTISLYKILKTFKKYV